MLNEPAALLGDVGFTTVQGTDARTGNTFAAGENIFGPFEAGFSSQQDDILVMLGCANPVDGYIPGGIDTETAEQMVAAGCGITLPREEDGNYISLIDECGGHTQEYHFHERLVCLYDESGAHSTQVGEALDGLAIYGKWEDYEAAEMPKLDACGGHFGFTPESPDTQVYHYHVQSNPPFTIGCFGPSSDDRGNPTLVTLEECRALYEGCSDTASFMDVVVPGSAFRYAPWCPCFDGQRSNVGNAPLAAFEDLDAEDVISISFGTSGLAFVVTADTGVNVTGDTNPDIAACTSKFLFKRSDTGHPLRMNDMPGWDKDVTKSSDLLLVVEPGIYHYACTLHGSMAGTFTVKDCTIADNKAVDAASSSINAAPEYDSPAPSPDIAITTLPLGSDSGTRPVVMTPSPSQIEHAEYFASATVLSPVFDETVSLVGVPSPALPEPAYDANPLPAPDLEAYPNEFYETQTDTLFKACVQTRQAWAWTCYAMLSQQHLCMGSAEGNILNATSGNCVSGD